MEQDGHAINAQQVLHMTSLHSTAHFVISIYAKNA